MNQKTEKNIKFYAKTSYLSIKLIIKGRRKRPFGSDFQTRNVMNST